MNFRRLVKLFIPTRLFRLIEPWGHLVEAVFFNLIYGFPARGMKVIGVTGTNGKTTTCFLIHKVLSQAGFRTGLMTTVAYGAGEEIRPQVQHMTNVSVPQLMKRLQFMRRQKIDYLVLETTSHALAQNRVWGVPFSLAVMTNVTHEHLDYHGTFERYLAAKRKLFKLANHNRRGLRTGVINADDPSAELFASDIKRAITYGLKKGELKASDVNSTTAGSEFEARFGDQKLHIKTSLPGSFNIHNALAAVGVGLVLGVKPVDIEQGIPALKNVEGRMNRIEGDQDFEVIVDFAHTPDSFDKLFKDLKSVSKGKLIVVFGSAGERDKAKRSVQGELAGKYCDEVVITEEDDRHEDGQAIMEQIATGAEKAGKLRDNNLFLVHDRTAAIKLAFGRAKAGDTVLLLGKGHEKTIERADGEHSWNESELASKLLAGKT